MATPMVTDANLGAWLLRCNPDVWDLPRAIAEGYSSIVSWTVAHNYRSRMMAEGQPVLLWASGNGRRIPRGIWGLGHVTGPAQDYVPEDLDPADAGYWLDKKAEAAADNRVLVDIPLLTSPVTDADLKAAGITDLEVQVQHQGSNPSWISKDQLARLQPLLPAWPQVSKPEEQLTVSSRGAGFGNPVQNRVVELAAMKAVRQVYEQDGWHVQDVSHSKCGWDLTCTRDAEVVKAEVKGVSGDKPSVLLTANELEAAMNDKDWALAVVTRALSAPKVIGYTRERAVQAAEPYVFRADLTAMA